MARTIGIGIQDFGKIIQNDFFYVDKTAFIREWWESGDDVTLIARPRRFGKTLNMNGRVLEGDCGVHANPVQFLLQDEPLSGAVL